MVDAPQALRSASGELGSRRQIALDRIQQLLVNANERAGRASRNYFTLQVLTVALAAITPCLIVLAKENPNNGLLNWLQLFFPAIAAITAGVSHVFRWREDGVRNTSLATAIQSKLWRYETRAGEFSGLDEETALDRLVVEIDDLNLQSVAHWSSTELAAGGAGGGKTKSAQAS
jgi:hypothetical protein